MQQQPRKPAGVPTGGQFATKNQPEPSFSLDGEETPEVDYEERRREILSEGIHDKREATQSLMECLRWRNLEPGGPRRVTDRPGNWRVSLEHDGDTITVNVARMDVYEDWITHSVELDPTQTECEECDRRLWTDSDEAETWQAKSDWCTETDDGIHRPIDPVDRAVGQLRKAISKLDNGEIEKQIEQARAEAEQRLTEWGMKALEDSLARDDLSTIDTSGAGGRLDTDRCLVWEPSNGSLTAWESTIIDEEGFYVELDLTEDQRTRLENAIQAQEEEEERLYSR